jgi:hypothetical protein
LKSSELVSYVHHCEALRRDLRHVIADHEAGKTCVTHYAVDFSEVYAFTLPYESHERAAIADAWGADPIRQFYVLSRILGQGDVILLDSYALELRSFFDRLLSRSITEDDLLSRPMERFKNILKGPKAQEIMALAVQAEHTPLSEADVKRTLSFFEEHSPLLVTIVQGGAYKPVDRLKRLLRRRPFRTLRKMLPEVSDLSEEARVRECYRLIEERRPYATPVSLYNDALAIEHLMIANSILMKRAVPERILLISRSPTMMAAVDELHKRKKLDGLTQFVRHPRIYSAGYRKPPEEEEADWLDDLRLREGSLNVFLDIAADVLTSTVLQEGTDQEVTNSGLEDAIKRIREQWGRVEALATALEKGMIELEKGAATPAKTAEELLEFLRDPRKHLYARALTRVREIFYEVQRERELLATRLPGEEPPQLFARIFYPIEFESPVLRERMESLAGRWSISIEEARTLFELPADAHITEYERLLATAVSLGAIGQWRVARRFTTFALDIGKQAEAPLHEGHFFHSLCLRKDSRRGETAAVTARRVHEAMAKVTLAMTVRREVAKKSRDDPRYLTEHAAQLLTFLETQISATPQSDDIAGIPMQILLLLKRARHAARFDKKLLTQIYNDRAYLYVVLHIARRDRLEKRSERRAARKLSGAQLRAARDLRRAERALRDLNDALRALGSHDWPAVIEDTLAWGDFCLHRDGANDRTLNDWVVRLRKIAHNPDLSPNERDLVFRHLQTVADAERAARPVPYSVP